MDLDTLADAFLVEKTRTVDKTGVIRLNGREYQVQLELAKAKILVRYDPYDLSHVQVYHQGTQYQDAHALEIPEHIDHNHRTRESLPQQPSTGLNYLELLKEKNQQGIVFSQLK